GSQDAPSPLPASTTPKANSSGATVSRNAPGTSSGARPADRSPGTRTTTATSTTRMNGTDTRKIHRQPSNSVMIPDTTNPRTSPQLATAAHTLSARDLRGPSGNMSTITAIAAGSAIASPAPCSSRAATSKGKDGASPASRDAPPNSAVP